MSTPKSMHDAWEQESLWDQLADGNLSPDQLTKLVNLCDRQPELWRRCALLLLEEQALTQSLRAYAKELPSVARTPSNNMSTTLLAIDSQPGSVTMLSTQAPADRAKQSLWLNNLALVAAVMLSFMIGWKASQRVNGLSIDAGVAVQGTSPSQIAANQTGLTTQQLAGDANVKASIPSQANRASDQTPEGVMLASSPSAMDAEMIDKVNANALAQTIGSGWESDLDLKTKELERRGFKVQAQEGLMPVWLYDGSPAVVPFHQIKVLPKSSNNAY